MRILLIHCYYRERGGEDVVFEQEYQMLRVTNEVRAVTFSNGTGLTGIIQYLSSVYNYYAIRRVKQEIIDFVPDIVHIHNINFACGPAVLRAIAKFNVPVVMTLHNYRLICPSAILLKDGKPYLNNIDKKFPWDAVFNRVYRNSFFLTLWLGFVVWFHRAIGTWDKVHKFIVLTDFAKNMFLASPFRVYNNKFTIKPNFAVVEKIDDTIRGAHFLFVGRLSEEKGLRFLLETFSKTKLCLRIVGEGPLKQLVSMYTNTHSNIQYLGKLASDKVLNEMRTCTALVFPSLCYETFGMSIVEALSTGCPVICSKHGAPGSMITDGYNGLLFKPGDQASLISCLNRWSTLDGHALSSYGKNALLSYESKYTLEKNRTSLLQIYNDAKKEAEEILGSFN